MSKPELDARDRWTAQILGGFLFLLSLPVLAGTFFATLPIDRIINVASGLVLALAGVGFVAFGRRQRSGPT